MAEGCRIAGHTTLLCLCLLSGMALAPSARENRSPQVDALFAPLDGKQTPGAAVLVVRDGAVVHRAAYGLANVELGVPNRPETVFRIASVTKTFTAMAILQLCERGRLGLDDRLSRFLPEFPGATEITVRHLMTHTAGVPDFVSFEEAKTRPPESRPGERLNYSNIGYEMLGRIIEAVSGLSYEDHSPRTSSAPSRCRTREWTRGGASFLVARRATSLMGRADSRMRTTRNQARYRPPGASIRRSMISCGGTRRSTREPWSARKRWRRPSNPRR